MPLGRCGNELAVGVLSERVKRRGTIANRDFFDSAGRSLEMGELADAPNGFVLRSLFVAEREERRSGRLGRGDVSSGETPYGFGPCSPSYCNIRLFATTVSSERGLSTILERRS